MHRKKRTRRALAIRVLCVAGVMATFAAFMAGLVTSFGLFQPQEQVVSSASAGAVLIDPPANEPTDVLAPSTKKPTAGPSSSDAGDVPGPTVAPTSLAEIEAKQKAAARAKAEAEARERAEAEARAQAEAEAKAEAEAEREAAAEDESSRSAERAISDPKGVAQEMMAGYGWAGDQFSCLDLLWTRESNWDYRAQNPSSGAYGIPQALPGSKMATAGDDWQTNPATQIEWGLGYIDERYGTPCGAWAHSESTGWY